MLYRGKRTQLSPAFSTFLLKLMACFCGSFLLMGTGLFGSFLTLTILVPFSLPTMVLEWIVVPLGLPRTAYWVVKLCRPLNFAGKNDSGCALYAALALTRRGASGADIAWLTRLVPDLPEKKGAGTVAAGLLAALSGNLLLARHLLKTASSLPASAISGKLRTIARDWLVADAALNADWTQVIYWGLQRRGGGRWSYTVARIAQRLTGQDMARKNWQLWGLWLIAPRRRLLLPLLRRALAVPYAKPAIDVPLPPTSHLSEALADFLYLLEQHKGQTGTTFSNTWLNDAVQRVEMQLDHPVTQQAIEHRLRALGAPAEHMAVMQKLRQKLVTMIIPFVEATPSLAQAPVIAPSLQQAVTTVRSRMFQDIQVRCADYAHRSNEKTSLDTQTEWQAWAVLCEIAERLLRLDPAAEESLFQEMFVPLCNFAVYQHNQVKRIYLAHDMFSWLHAHSLSNPEARAVLAKNKNAA
jgi:hypothetical protein